MIGVLTGESSLCLRKAGLAGLILSSIEVDGKEAHVGKFPDLPYQICCRTAWSKLLTYSKCNRTPQPINESGDHRTVFYAESSLLMHYLYDNNLVLKLSPYFELKIDRGASVEDAFQRSFGMSTDQFDKDAAGLP